jgi:hypothetical protein
MKFCMISLSIGGLLPGGGVGAISGAATGRAVAAHSHSRQQGEHDEGERGQFVAAEAGNGRIERGDVVAGQIADGGPDPHPEGRTHRVQDQKPREAHPGHPGDQPVGLP